MKNRLWKVGLCCVACLCCMACGNAGKSSGVAEDRPSVVSPEELWGQLFYDVLENDSLFGTGRLFADSKDFMDCAPKGDMDSIRNAYAALKGKGDWKALEVFIRENFYLPASGNAVEFSDSSDIDVHISTLWKVLRRNSDQGTHAGTLIPLRYDYIVPGGRFREIYYWDSYFTMLGLFADDEAGLAVSMIKNFSDIIDRIGFVPNGNRSYYMSRSQPPFFSHMVKALSDYSRSDTALVAYLGAMQAEYDFWMEGAGKLSGSHPAELHCVRMPGGEVLNRYYDRCDTPREEMYRNDRETARELSRVAPGFNEKQLFRDLRSGAESGWDFSSRWLKEYNNLYSIHTTDIVPVDLNSLLYHLEMTLSEAYSVHNDDEKAALYRNLAEKRKQAIVKYLWNSEEGYFMDYNRIEGKITGNFSLAGVYPLYVRLADERQAAEVTDKIQTDFLKNGGVVTTLYDTGQQWDFPNGWAPLQWITYSALRNYGQNEVADEIKHRWMKMVENVYLKTGKLLEKYDVVNVSDTGGGEYPNQDGFGWTNGIYRAFKVAGEKNK